MQYPFDARLMAYNNLMTMLADCDRTIKIEHLQQFIKEEEKLLTQIDTLMFASPVLHYARRSLNELMNPILLSLRIKIPGTYNPVGQKRSYEEASESEQEKCTRMG